MNNMIGANFDADVILQMTDQAIDVHDEGTWQHSRLLKVKMLAEAATTFGEGKVFLDCDTLALYVKK